MMKKTYAIGLCFCLAFLFQGCATPVMKLHHAGTIDASYSRIGAIELIPFEDKRDEREKKQNMTAMNTPNFRLISGATDPDIIRYFNGALAAGIKETKLFDMDNAANYALTGEIHSMKVERRVSIFRYVTFGLLDFPELVATVKYHAILMKDGESILERDINRLEKESYWAWQNLTITSWDKISERGSRLLEKCTTNSHTQLFNEIKACIQTAS